MHCDLLASKNKFYKQESNTTSMSSNLNQDLDENQEAFARLLSSKSEVCQSLVGKEVLEQLRQMKRSLVIQILNLTSSSINFQEQQFDAGMLKKASDTSI